MLAETADFGAMIRSRSIRLQSPSLGLVAAGRGEETEMAGAGGRVRVITASARPEEGGGALMPPYRHQTNEADACRQGVCMCVWGGCHLRLGSAYMHVHEHIYYNLNGLGSHH